MKKSLGIIHALLFYLCTPGISQGYVVLNDNDIIKYNSLKYSGSDLALKLTNKEKRRVHGSTVYGIYSDENGEFLFRKPNKLNDYEFNFDIVDYVSKLSLDFITIEVEGTINLYRKVLTRIGPLDQFSMTFLFGEKQKVYENLFTTNGVEQNKRRKKKILSEMIGDDIRCKELVQSADFNYNIENIISIVETYNLNKLKDHINPITSDSIDVTFFQQSSSSPTTKIYLEDMAPYSFDLNNKVVVKLPQNSFIKACTDSLKTSCKIIKTESYKKYYSITTSKEKNFLISISNKKTARFYVKNLKD